MKDSLSQEVFSTASSMLLSWKRIGALFLLIFFHSYHGLAQIYFDSGVYYDFYTFNAPLQIQNERMLASGRMCFGWYKSENQKLKMSQEVELFRRRFNQSYPEGTYEYRFNGLAFNTMGSYKVLQNLFVDAGVSFSIYGSKLKDMELGDGFRGFDFGVITGSKYHINKWLAVGIRYTTFFINMLKYEPIGDYGELQPKVKDITSQRLEVYLRFEVSKF